MRRLANYFCGGLHPVLIPIGPTVIEHLENNFRFWTTQRFAEAACFRPLAAVKWPFDRGLLTDLADLLGSADLEPTFFPTALVGALRATLRARELLGTWPTRDPFLASPRTSFSFAPSFFLSSTFSRLVGMLSRDSPRPIAS